MFGDVVADGKTIQMDTSAIEHDQMVWAKGRVLCTNTSCMTAYYARRLSTLKETYVRIHERVQHSVSAEDHVNPHTYVGTWAPNGNCALTEHVMTIEKHVMRIGISDWMQIDHQDSDTYHDLPIFYIMEKVKSSANFIYDTYVDVITYNNKGLGSGDGVRYIRCR